MPPPAMGRERPGKGPVDLFSEQPAAAGSQGGHGVYIMDYFILYGKSS